MDVFDALYTTRAMRRMHPDAIPMDVQGRILDAAIRAPNGGNTQQWRFVLVDSVELKAQIGPLYRASMGELWGRYYSKQIELAAADPESPENAAFLRMRRSAQHLADHFEEIPLLMLAFSRFDPSGGSIFPAVWSAMLAGRAQGIGSTLVTVLSWSEDQVAALLQVPQGKHWSLACGVAFGYPRGRWGVARRQPVNAVAARNGWDGDLGLDIPEPLWDGSSS
ncbi:MAG: nitroreductase family protein [Acidimicrobiia bacterium]